MKSGPWLYRPEPSSIGYANVTIATTTYDPTTGTNSTTTSIVLRPFTQNNDVLMRSAFSHFYQMDKIGVFRQFFATVFPIFLIIVMFLVMTNVLNYLLVLCKLEYMQMGTSKSIVEFYDDAFICFVSFHHLNKLSILVLVFHSLFINVPSPFAHMILL